MSRKSDSRWSTSAYAPHVSLSRKNEGTFKVECGHCGAHEMIPDAPMGEGDRETIRSFNLAVGDFTTAHMGCPERGEKCC